MQAAVGLGAPGARQLRFKHWCRHYMNMKPHPVRVKSSFGMARWKSNTTGDNHCRLLENNLYFYSILDAERSGRRCQDTEQDVGKSRGAKAK